MAGKDDDGDKTVFGGPLPGQRPQDWSRPAPESGSGSPFGQPAEGQTWIGGPARPAQPPPPAAQSHRKSASSTTHRSKAHTILSPV